MSLLNFFRNLFNGNKKDEPTVEGFNDHTLYKYNFRNPIWLNDDDDEDNDDFRRPEVGIHFRIFSDPLEITRYFESQMDAMLKTFSFGFGDHIPNFNNEGTFNALPFNQPKQEQLRDNMLKPGYDTNEGNHKLDGDIDGKVTANEFGKVWDNQNRLKAPIHSVWQYPQIIGKSVTKRVVQKADGSIEHQETSTDSEGNEQTIISRQIGDKKHVIITNRDKTGEETRTENLINMDEDELKSFDQNWTILNSPDANYQENHINSFPWRKFFGPNPKL